ncbi:MAG: hypothetical protein ABIJ21_08690 [Nanoarchaeota archaeon]
MEQKRATKDDVFAFLRINGPCLPNDIKKKLGGDTFLMGAYLSELTNERKARVSVMKVGGSPLYLIPGQEYKLQNFSHYLNEKDRIAYGILRERRVLRDREQTPLIRVALRSIKDFAIPLEVTISGEKEIFWRWFLLSQDQAQDEIRKILQTTTHTSPSTPVRTEPKPIPPAEIKKPEQAAPAQPTQTTLGAPKQTIQQTTPQTRPTIAPPEKKPEKPKKTKDVKSAFLDDVTAYFQKNNIDIEETNAIKKATEIDFIIKIPSNVGKLRYFCKARAKKKINEGDLSSAYVSGEAKKLPVLFLTTGDLNKRAKEMLPNEFKNMTVQFLS